MQVIISPEEDNIRNVTVNKVDVNMIYSKMEIVFLIIIG